MSFDPDAWCILRTSSRGTLGLARSLAADGFEVWTPAKSRTIRVPRANVRRPIQVPIVPSFVFARARHLTELFELAMLPERPRRGRHPAHERFSVFHHNDRVPLIRDVDLEPLRQAEAKIIPARKRKTFSRGDSVRVPSGSFGGMTGIVERSDGRYTLVCFGDLMRVKISTFILKLDVACKAQPAARAA